MSPLATTRVISACPVAHRNSVPSRWTTPARSAAASMARASSASREGLLAEHVLPRGDRLERERPVGVRWGDDADRIETR